MSNYGELQPELQPWMPVVAMRQAAKRVLRSTLDSSRLPLALFAVIVTLPVARSAPSSFQIAWGDVPTWLLFVGAFIAAIIALRQLRTAQDDSARLTRQLERQQADKVDINWTPAARVRFFTGSSTRFPKDDRAVVVVSNDSPRPIRKVTSQIKLAGGSTLNPIMYGAVQEPADVESRWEYEFFRPRPGIQVQLIRPGFKYGFIFEFKIPDDDAVHPENRTNHPFAQFIDDADLAWEIDDDLHLKPLRARERRLTSWLARAGH